MEEGPRGMVRTVVIATKLGIYVSNSIPDTSFEGMTGCGEFDLPQQCCPPVAEMRFARGR